jgi:4a-hydroxytetrahydrobiopterin dehydratase
MRETITGKTSLADRKCKPCQEGTLPVKGEDLKRLHDQLSKGWNVIGEHHMEREFKFKDWPKAQDFTNQVGDLAQQEDHHPDILLQYGKVKVTLWTHKINGLSENDFILAAKIDRLNM